VCLRVLYSPNTQYVPHSRAYIHNGPETRKSIQTVSNLYLRRRAVVGGPAGPAIAWPLFLPLNFFTTPCLLKSQPPPLTTALRHYLAGPLFKSRLRPCDVLLHCASCELCVLSDWLCLHSMRSSVYETDGIILSVPSVRRSVRPIDRQQQRPPAGLLLSALLGKRYRSITADDFFTDLGRSEWNFDALGLYTGWQWRNFVAYLCQLVFAAILYVKLLEMFATLLSLKYALSVG